MAKAKGMFGDWGSSRIVGTRHPQLKEYRVSKKNYSSRGERKCGEEKGHRPNYVLQLPGVEPLEAMPVDMEATWTFPPVLVTD